MKIFITVMASLAMFACICSAVQAAELLDVKPVVSGTAVSIEVSADIPMTYTYYKIPGQPRAVLDIADADPEKIEPLIVVNKGIVSSISVDKAQIAGIVVSRIIFNLVSEADIAVTASPDRKQLTATFGGAATAMPPVDVKPPQASEQTVPAAETVKTEQKQADVENKPVERSKAPTLDAKEEDPLGLDEQSPTPPAPASPSMKEKPVATVIPAPAPAPAAGSQKLAPVVPSAVRASEVSINKIVTGDTFIDIQTTGSVGDYKTIKLTQPERIAIDIPGATSSLGTRLVLINKFGITKARIGIYPGHIRIVLDTVKTAFPKHTVTKNPNAIRISFN